MNKQEALKRIEVQKETLIRLTGWAVYVYIEELIKSLDEPEKIKIPQFVADWITHSKNIGRSLFGAMSIFEENTEIKKWLQWADNQEVFARAWLDGYEVEKTKYIVTDGNHLYFKGYQEDVEIVILADEQPGTMDYVKKFDTKEEAQKAADILGWKVQEVEG